MLSAETDVLILGGGMAGAWAAIGAAQRGARVILADKGYMGTSGVTATAGPGHWWVPPEDREAAVAQRLASMHGLGEADWMHRILRQTWESLPDLAPFYRFCLNDAGAAIYGAVRGPEYMRALRQMAEHLGVRILDHSPALELLLCADGRAAGAAGWQRQARQPWEIRAGAVVLATGGCAFHARLPGSRNNTGDGHLMAAEAGVPLSAMEFCGQFTIAPAFSTMTRAMSYTYATYYDAAGRVLGIPAGTGEIPALARALQQGAVWADFSRMPADIRARLPYTSPNVLPPFRRLGIDPFRDKFPIALVAEGTIRGVGGVNVASASCETSCQGLFAAGDAASREAVTGAISGAGAVNAAWALSSGLWAGHGAAHRAREAGGPAGRATLGIGEAGLRPRAPALLDAATLAARVREIATDFSTTLFRNDTSLGQGLAALDSQWQLLRRHLHGAGEQAIRAREAAALTATARWCLTAARARTESRGLHQRLDHPESNPALARSLTLYGLDRIIPSFAPARRVAA